MACLRALACLLAATGCGGDSTAPAAGTDGPPGRGKPGIEIAAGANVTDSIDAVLPQALRVVVRDSSGQGIPRAVVYFSAVPLAHVGGGTRPSVSVEGSSVVDGFRFRAETTSVDGVALARITLGQAAGVGGVAIAIPDAGLYDTARYTILPGAATRVVLPTADTTITVGRALELRGRVQDRYGNLRADAITYAAIPAALGSELVVSSGRASASTPTRAGVVGRHDRAGVIPDTTWASVVPVATLGVRRGSRLVTVALDGADLTPIPHAMAEVGENGGPEWYPDGQSLLAGFGSYRDGYPPYRVELGGAMQPAAAPGPAGYNMYGIEGATFSRDGRWLYVSTGSCNFAASLYRYPVENPQAAERVGPVLGDGCFSPVHKWPSPSPDDTRVVFENQSGNGIGFSVRLLTLATRTITVLVDGARRPRWSPTGDVIAYWAGSRIWLMRPDGSGARVVSPVGREYVPGVQWSPDGQWIIARFSPTRGWAGTTVALLHAETGLEIPLAWTTGYGGYALPAWRPVP